MHVLCTCRKVSGGLEIDKDSERRVDSSLQREARGQRDICRLLRTRLQDSDSCGSPIFSTGFGTCNLPRWRGKYRLIDGHWSQARYFVQSQTNSYALQYSSRQIVYMYVYVNGSTVPFHHKRNLVKRTGSFRTEPISCLNCSKAPTFGGFSLSLEATMEQRTRKIRPYSSQCRFAHSNGTTNRYDELCFVPFAWRLRNNNWLICDDSTLWTPHQ